ncbi:MAG: hypothetical protein J6Q94_04775 [Clostridia bacterium]|nr:hypothetical protein [Clostridia bacterium]
MMFDFTTFSFYAIPVASVIFLVVSIVRYIVAKNKNKKIPDTYSESQIKSRKTFLIISAAIAGVLAAVIVCFYFLLLLMANSM